MRYIFLIAEDESVVASWRPEEYQSVLGEHVEFTQAAKQAGVYLGGEPLQPVATATTIRVRDGQVSATDGPFAETKEQLGGFYMLDCENLDEAMAWAARIPCAKTGCVEVRPIMEFDFPE